MSYEYGAHAAWERCFMSVKHLLAVCLDANESLLTCVSSDRPRQIQSDIYVHSGSGGQAGFFFFLRNLQRASEGFCVWEQWEPLRNQTSHQENNGYFTLLMLLWNRQLVLHVWIFSCTFAFFFLSLSSLIAGTADWLIDEKKKKESNTSFSPAFLKLLFFIQWKQHCFSLFSHREI